MNPFFLAPLFLLLVLLNFPHISQEQECGVQFKLDFLHTHTELRRRHGVPPLEPDYDDFQARSETALNAIIRAHDGK